MAAKRGTSQDAHPTEVDKLIGLVRDCLTKPRHEAEELERHVTALRAADWTAKLARGPRHWEQFCLQQLGCPAPSLQRILDGAVRLRLAGMLGSTVAQAQAAGHETDD